MKKRSEMMKKMMVQILVAALLTLQIPTAAFAAEDPAAGTGHEETVSGDMTGAGEEAGSEEGVDAENETVSGEDAGAEDPVGSGDQKEPEETAEEAKETVSVDTVSEEESAGNGGEITTWGELQTAIEAGGEITLGRDIVAGEGDSVLTVPKSKKVTIDLNGHKIDRHLKSASENGYVFKLAQGNSRRDLTELTVKDTSAAGTGMITGGNSSDNYCGGVYVLTDALFTLESGSISGNEARSSAGGVCVNGGTFILNGGMICDNGTSYHGGGVGLAGQDSIFTMNSGAIINNRASKSGGGVYIFDKSGCSFTMNGGTISKNTAQSGGGVYNNKAFTMNDGFICDNTANGNAGSTGGGGVYNYGTFTMNGGVISGNTSNSNFNDTCGGGGVFNNISGTAEFDMNGGIIRDNTSKGHGGGVFNGKKFKMYGGDITGNKCGNGKKGAGVYIYNTAGAEFHISGNVVVSGNKQNETINNVQVGNDEYCIYIDGKIAEGSSVGVTSSSDPDVQNPKRITYSLKRNNGGDFSFLFSDSGYGIKLDDSGNDAYLYLSSLHSISAASVPNGTISVIDGKTQASSGETVTVTVTPDAGYETASVSACYIEDGNTKYILATGSGSSYSFRMPYADVTVSAVFIPDEWKNLELLLNEGGTVTLQKDITAKDTDLCIVVLSGNTAILDLNGHTLDRNLGNRPEDRKADGYVIKVQGNLTVADSSPGKTGMITGGNNSNVCGGVYIGTNGHFTLNGGIISRNTGAKGIGGVCVSENSAFTMNAGSITDNNGNAHEGGGVYVDKHGSFVLNGGEITQNRGVQGSGVYVCEDGSFELNEGKITENTASSGGGVYVCEDGSFELNGGEITGNTAGQGGGVFVSPGTFKLKGRVTISGNHQGGGKDDNLYLRQNSVILVTGAVDSSSCIGVSTEKTPVIGTTVQLTSGLSNNGFIKDFVRSDKDAFTVIKKNGEAFLSRLLYQVEIEGEPQHGSVSMDRETAEEGETVHFTVTPDEGYRLDELKVVWIDAQGTSHIQQTHPKQPVLSPDPVIYNITMPAASVKIHVVFGFDYSWEWLSGKIEQGGTVKLPGDISAGLGDAPIIIPSGTNCTLDLNGFSLDCTGVQYNPAVQKSVEPAAVIVSGNLTLTDSSINKAGVIKCTDGSYPMSGIRVNRAGSLIQKGGIIQGFNGRAGAGVYLPEGAHFSLEGGSISGNKTGGNNGGGVYVNRDAEFTMKGGEITGNYANSGGGVYVSGGKFFVSGGCISGNKAAENSGRGGGVNVTGGSFEMSGGEIRDNTAYYGGGVYAGGASFNMTGGVITKNKAGESGGGVYGYGNSLDGCAITMTGGEITDNVINGGFGGGLYMTSENSVFKVEGSPVIKKNYDNNERELNIFYEGKPVLITGALQNAGLCFGRFDNVFTGSILAKGEGYTLKETDLSSFELTDACTGLHPALEDDSIIVKQELPDEITIETPVFTGDPLTPGILIYDGTASKNLTEGTDYTVSFRDNINAGNGTAVITGSGNYIGTLEKAFTILKSPEERALEDAARSLNHAGGSYTFSLLSFFPENAGTVSSCELNGDVSVSGNVTVSAASISTAGEVALILSKGAMGDTVTVPVKVTAQNYDFTFNVVCSLIECDHPSDKRERRGVKENNCSRKGYTGDIYCSLCETRLETGTDIPIDPEKHDYDLENGVIVREATAYSYGWHTYFCRHNREHTLTVMDIPLLPAKDGTDHSDLAEDTKDLSGNAAPVVEPVKDDKGNEVGETVKIGGEEVSKTVKDPESGKETVESKVWIAGLKNSYAYTGSAIKPSFHVYDGTRKLSEGTDYTVKWDKNKDAGTATVTLKFKGNYSDAKSETVEFTITPAVLGEDIIVHEIGIAAKKKGSVKVTPVLTWKETGKSVSSKYFDITPSSVTGEGTTEATVTVKSGQNNFTGSAKVLIKAVSDKNKMLSNAKVKFDKNSYPYTGGEIIPGYELTLGGKTLKEGTDYKRVSLCNNTDPGTATVVFEAMGSSFVGSKTATFKISGKKEIKEGASFTFTCPESVPYAKGGAKAAVIVTDNDNRIKLKEGKDYTLSYSKNKSVTNGAKTAEVKVKGKGDYKGSVTLKYAIAQQSLKAGGINIVAADQFAAKAKLKAPKITITDIDGKKLKAGTDYTVGKPDDSDPANTDTKGIVKVAVTGKGAYKDEVSVVYRYEDKTFDISKAKAVKKIEDQIYTGNAVKLSNAELTGILTAKDSTGADVSLIPGTHFKVTGYTDNVKKGTAKVTVRGIGDYAGTKTLTFKIVQKKVDYKGALIGEGWKWIWMNKRHF